MNNGQIVEEFVRIFLEAPDLCSRSLQDALTGKFEVVFTRVVPIAERHPDPYHNFPIETGERNVATV